MFDRKQKYGKRKPIVITGIFIRIVQISRIKQRQRTEKDYTGNKYLVQLYSEAEGLYVDTSQGM